MRIRKKPYAKAELLASSVYIDDPREHRGNWSSLFSERRPLDIELGCGKGHFITEMAWNNRDRNFIAIDIKDEMLLLAKRNIENRFGEEDSNVRITVCNIEQLDTIFSPEDSIETVYINFCNPWPKAKHNKHRLTHTRQLETYKRFLRPGVRVYFKTDDRELFEASKGYFTESGFELVFESDDFSVSGFENNIITEHEKMFMEHGETIKGLIAVLKEG